MKKLYTTLVLAAVMALVLAPAALAQRSSETYSVDLESLNNSGATGVAEVTLQGNKLNVNIQATGLEPNKVHPQHIHGFTKQNRGQNSVCPPPSAADDLENIPEEVSNPDEFIGVEEGAPFYGSILLPLMPFPTADEAGNVSFEETYKVKPGQLKPLENKVIVLHGDNVDGEYVGSLPVACGQLEQTS